MTEEAEAAPRAGSASTTGRLGLWMQAARPRTLPAGVVPVLVGVAAASRSGPVDLTVAAITLLAAVLIQIGTNLANDYYDFLAGADGEDRLGPVRVTQAGLIEPTVVRRAMWLVLAAAALAGVFLVAVGGWPILLIGVAALVCAIAYTAGPYPLAYVGLGDVFVFAFFGVVAVTGTVYLQTGAVDRLAVLASLPVACLATAILVVNNLRDIPTDRKAGKRTLAVRLGAGATRVEYYALLVFALACLPLLAGVAGLGPLIAGLALPLAVFEARGVAVRDGAALNSSLAGTARLHLVFGMLLAVGLLL